MKNRMVAMILATSACWMSSGFAVAQTDPSAFPLSKAIPDDVFIAVSAKANPERKFLDEYWSEVIKAFVDSGVMTDAWDMITDLAPDDENIDEIEETMDRFSELCAKIEWSAMFDKEFVYCGRFSVGTPAFHEGMFIGRSEKEKASSNYSGLKKLLAELVKFGNEKAGNAVVELNETKADGGNVAALTFPGAPGISISVAQMDDVVFLAFGGSDILKDGMSLLKGESDKKGIVSSARYKQAFDQLPPAEDSMVFFDVESMMGTFRTMMEAFGAEVPSEAKDGADKSEKTDAPEKADGDAADDESDEAPPEAEVNPMKIVSQLLKDISIIDYTAETEWTEGYRVFSDSVTVLKPNAKYSPLYEIVTSCKPMSDFERYIPKEAVSFGVSSGMNLTKAYRYLIDFVTKNVPEGKGMIQHWEDVQKNELNLDIEKDVLGLFEGSVASYQVDSNWVLMFRVTDEKKMDQQLTRFITFVNGLLGENGLMVSKVKVGDKVEFSQLTHPMMMMMGGMQPPVLGCAQDHLIIGSSAATVKTCLKTAAGKHDNILKNKRWQEEALTPSGSVLSISFTDEANMGKELQAAIGGISMALGMAGMGMADAPPEARRMIGALPPILAKLGPVAGRLDFYKSSAAFETFDGKKWVAHSVQNYKKQSERPSRAEDAEDSATDASDAKEDAAKDAKPEKTEDKSDSDSE